MRKALAMILLFCISFQVMGYSMVCYTGIYWQKKEMKKRIKMGLPESELQNFSFSMDDYASLQWIKSDKEFILNGKMYDVVHKKIEGNNILLKCINDAQEEILFAHLDAQVSKFMDVPQKGNSKTKNLLKLVKIEAMMPLAQKAFDHSINKQIGASLILQDPLASLRIPFVPPEV